MKIKLDKKLINCELKINISPKKDIGIRYIYDNKVWEPSNKNIFRFNKNKSFF